jgi:hypothetical protein
MGLTIHYSLKCSSDDTAVRNCVETLHQLARDLPFKEVGHLVDLRGEECDFGQRDPKDPLRWLLIQARESVQYNPRRPQLGSYSVTPRRVIAFTAWPGDGCEQSNIGLCEYPDWIIDGRHGKQITNLTSWSWSSFCKTQYASNPRYGGVKNFLSCHLAVIALLDRAKKLGCLDKVNDEGGFWEQRDVEKLVREVGDWNEMIAAFCGRLKDALGDGVKMPVADFANFERLELAGQKRQPGIKQLIRLVQLATRKT